MLKIKKTVFVPLALVALVSVALNLFAFKGNTTRKVDVHILVEIYEVPAYKDSGIHIHYGGGKTEVVPFKSFSKDNHDDNGEIIVNTINRLEREGYDLTHISSGLAATGMITKIFMVKREG